MTEIESSVSESRARAAVEVEPEAIVFDRATKIYPGNPTPALDALSLTIGAGELVSLVGPSGGGKTTALMLTNRLVELTSGTITVGDRDISGLNEIELRRSMGYVIQGGGLFPHMSVADNIGLIPGILKWDRDRIESRVSELLAMVGLDPDEYAKRYPGQLSGGQQQRVGIARALAADPPVMLMDEPFGALDPITREHIQDEFLNLQRGIGKTIMFVTHDIDEAVKMSDKIAVLRPGGKLAQFGTPEEILSEPVDDFVESFLGTDRGLKLLKLVTAGELATADYRGDRAGLSEIPEHWSALAALSEALATGAAAIRVTAADGAEVGVIPRDELVNYHQRRGAGTGEVS